MIRLTPCVSILRVAPADQMQSIHEASNGRDLVEADIVVDAKLSASLQEKARPKR
ncbi:MAG: hypothetical protein ACR2PH_00245 [Desulfobulbia bacterium]